MRTNLFQPSTSQPRTFPCERVVGELRARSGLTFFFFPRLIPKTECGFEQYECFCKESFLTAHQNCVLATCDIGVSGSRFSPRVRKGS
jgi:hypothetical protein